MKIKLLFIIIIALLFLALYGVEPISTYANSFIEQSQAISIPNIPNRVITEPVFEDYFYDGKSYTLKRVEKWVDEVSQEFSFNARTPPYILEIGVGQRTSNMPGNFTPFVYHESGVVMGGVKGLIHTSENGNYNYYLSQKGKYTIKITSASYRWYAKIGSERIK